MGAFCKTLNNNKERTRKKTDTSLEERERFSKEQKTGDFVPTYW